MCDNPPASFVVQNFFTSRKHKEIHEKVQKNATKPMFCTPPPMFCQWVVPEVATPARIMSVETTDVWGKNAVVHVIVSAVVVIIAVLALMFFFSFFFYFFSVFCSFVNCLRYKQQKKRGVGRVMSHRKGALLRGLMFPGPFQFFHPETEMDEFL